MNERAINADDETMKFGLLMEGAQAHQRLAEAHLERLRAHTQDLDDVVREAIRRTLVEELRSLTAESARASQALRDMKRAVNVRGTVWNVAVAALCTVVPCAVAHWVLPSSGAVAALRGQRDALAQDIAQLEVRGGKVDWRSCGDSKRLCVRIDRKAPVYGDGADYFVVRGY